MWLIQLVFRLFIVWNIFLSSLTLCNTSSFLSWSVQLSCYCKGQNFNRKIWWKETTLMR
jgi:hypothetical protein